MGIKPNRPKDCWHTCGTCGKRSHASKRSAKAHAKRIAEGGIRATRTPPKIYPACEVGFYHVGSMGRGTIRDDYR